MGLREQLLEKRPRETSGSRTSNRFDFQKDWALCKLLELYETEEDFLIVLDYHDDIIILDSDTNPTTASFYQVKTLKDGSWGIRKLLSKSKTRTRISYSIIGKMYFNKTLFPDYVTSLNLVSNARYRIDLARSGDSTTYNKICLNELKLKHIREILRKIKNEYRLQQEPIFIDITHLLVTDLSLEDHSRHAKGILLEFLERVKPDGRFDLSYTTFVYNQLFEEIKRRTNYEWNCSSFDDILRNKSIGKKFLEPIIVQIRKRNDLDELLVEVVNRLNVENVPITRITKIKQFWRKYEVERLDEENVTISKIRDKIKYILNNNSSIQYPTLANLIDTVMDEYREICDLQDVYDNDYIASIILMEFYDRS